MSTLVEYACIWTFADGARFLRRFSSPYVRSDVVRGWSNDGPEANTRVRCSTSEYRRLGSAVEVMPVDVIEGRFE